MNCDRVQNENIIEKYLSGTLDPELKEAWEEHYFACPECTRQLETWQAVQGALREAAPDIRREMSADRRPRRVWIWATGIAAAVVLAVALGMRSPVPMIRPEPAPSLSAHLEPPVYSEPVARGVEGRAEVLFREAMRHYQKQEWAPAIEGLRESLALDGEAAATRFFLGATYLLAGNAAVGVPELEQVAAGGSPFAEEARFVLAQGYLMQGRKDDAVRALRAVAAGHGDFAGRAADLLRETAGNK